MAVHGFIYQGVKYVAQTAGVVGAVTTAATAAYDYATGAAGRPVGDQGSTAGGGFPFFPEGEDIEILSEAQARAMGLKNGRPRRRRRKLLTCGDKADIAFLYGNLGGGQLGRAAITSLLSRRCS